MAAYFSDLDHLNMTDTTDRRTPVRADRSSPAKELPPMQSLLALDVHHLRRRRAVAVLAGRPAPFPAASAVALSLGYYALACLNDWTCRRSSSSCRFSSSFLSVRDVRHRRDDRHRQIAARP
jgi:hypothetical protein